MAVVDELRAAGFSDAELQDVAKLESAGFSRAEIMQHLSGGAPAEKVVTQPGATTPVPESVADRVASQSGLTDRTKELVKQHLPWMYGDVKDVKSPEAYAGPAPTGEPGVPEAWRLATQGRPMLQVAHEPKQASEYPEVMERMNAPTDWNQILRDTGQELVQGIPVATAALTGAATAAATPVTGGASLLAVPAAAAGGYQAGRPIRTLLEDLLSYPHTDKGDVEELINSLTEGAMTGMGTSPTTIPAIKDALTRELPNVGKKILGKVIGRGPQKFVAKKIGESTVDPLVDIALKENVPLTTGTAVETTKAARQEVWKPIEQMVQEATAEGKMIPRQRLEEAIQREMQKVLQRGGTEANADYQLLQKELANLQTGFKPAVTPTEAQYWKQDLGQKIKDFDTSMNKLSSSRPLTAAQRAERGTLNEAIAETVDAPNLYRELNTKYGRLSKLLEPSREGGRLSTSPLGKADEKILNREFGVFRGRGNAMADWAKDKTKGAAYRLQQWAKEQPQFQGGAYKQMPASELEAIFAQEPRPTGPPPIEPTQPSGRTSAEVFAEHQRIRGPQYADDEVRAMQEAQMEPQWGRYEPPESTPGTLLEAEPSPMDYLTEQERIAQRGLMPEQPSLVHEYTQPPLEIEPTPGTLLEGDVPTRGFAKLVKKATKKEKAK